MRDWTPCGDFVLRNPHCGTERYMGHRSSHALLDVSGGAARLCRVMRKILHSDRWDRPCLATGSHGRWSPEWNSWVAHCHRTTIGQKETSRLGENARRERPNTHQEPVVHPTCLSAILPSNDSVGTETQTFDLIERYSNRV